MNRSRRRRDSSALIEPHFKLFFGADVGSETGFRHQIGDRTCSAYPVAYFFPLNVDEPPDLSAFSGLLFLLFPIIVYSSSCFTLLYTSLEVYTIFGMDSKWHKYSTISICRRRSQRLLALDIAADRCSQTIKRSVAAPSPEYRRTTSFY